jgi:hypothetical protein
MSDAEERMELSVLSRHGKGVFHGGWDDRTRRQFGRVWGCVRLSAARLPVIVSPEMV